MDRIEEHSALTFALITHQDHLLMPGGADIRPAGMVNACMMTGDPVACLNQEMMAPIGAMLIPVSLN